MSKETHEDCMEAYRLTLVRSDAGDGGWSLYPPDTTDKEIAEGDALPLLTGTAIWNRRYGTWTCPTLDHRLKALRRWRA